MSTVIDKRGSNKGRLAGSRAKFIKRYRHYIKDRIDKHIKDSKIQDIDSDIEVTIGSDVTEKPLVHDKNNSDYKRVYPGNKKYNKGDRESLDKQTSGRPRASNNKELSDDDFKFMLTAEEFLDILFEDMELPNFIKQNNRLFTQVKYVNGGYVKEGVPTRLAVKKTMENALGRRLAARGQSNKKPIFLDDTDIRYRNIVPEEKPVKAATMFCVMDISGSMTEAHKLIAKKFFLLLYLFLRKNYTTIDIRFVSHTVDAWEVSQEEFFYSTKTGGTCISPAVTLVNEIIDKEYDSETTNIYIAQASDGDNWIQDYIPLMEIMEVLLPKVQHFAYIEIDNEYPDDGVAAFYQDQFPEEEKLNSVIVEYEEDVIHVLRSLFSKEKK